MSKFSTRIKELRISQNLTQDDLAKKLKISKSSISMYENGNRNPDYEILELIADFFNVDMNYLLGTADNTTRILDKQQYELLSMYDQLNAEGQEKLVDYSKDLVSSGRYIKVGKAGVVEETA